MNEFEKYPKLAKEIECYASFGSFGSYTRFIEELNKALSSKNKTTRHIIVLKNTKVAIQSMLELSAPMSNHQKEVWPKLKNALDEIDNLLTDCFDD